MLANKKVYVGKFSKEIQEKAFKLGWVKENNSILYLDYPFLFFSEDKEIIVGNHMREFNLADDYEEVSPEWILSLEEPKPKKTLADLMPISGFYVDRECKIQELKDHTQHYTTELWNVLPTKEEAEAYKILPFLLQWRDRYNEGWKPNWEDKEYVYIIQKYVSPTRFYLLNCFHFKTAEIRDKFEEDFKEELEIVKPLL